MTILQRISKLVSANVHHLLDQAEDPEAQVKQVIREMEASIVELRRETVRAVAREKQVEHRLELARREVADRELTARGALGRDDEAQARRAVAEKLRAERRVAELLAELDEARAVARRMRDDLERLEDQVQLARQKKSDLLRRARAADSRANGARAARATVDRLEAIERLDADTAVGQAADRTLAAEALAAAEEELLERRMGRQERPANAGEAERAVEAELERLRRGDGAGDDDRGGAR